MTLISRNKFLSSFCIISSLILALFILLFAIFYSQGKIFPFPFPIQFSSISLKSFLFGNFSIFPLISIAFLGFYSFSSSLFVRYSFEKTQSPEIIFFFGFLIGCFFELFRLLIPLFNLWNSFSTLVIFIGKITFAGRFISYFCFLFSALFSTEVQNQQIEKNLLVIFLLSCIFSNFIPISTNKIMPSISPAYGFEKLFILIILTLLFITFVTLLFINKKDYSFSYIFVTLGYTILIFSCNLFFTFLGIILLSLGTSRYLKNIHNYYLWR